MTTNINQRYDFQAPSNMKAIRSNIIYRIKQRNESNSMKDQQQSAHLSEKFNLIENNMSCVQLDSGLPSPPTESCTFEEADDKKDHTQLSSSIDTLMNISSPTATLPDSPPSPLSTSTSSSTGTSQSESSEAIREKLRTLKHEKHLLFQTMKSLISQSNATIKPNSVTAPSTPTFTPSSSPLDHHKSYPIERSKSQTKDLKSRPIMRSRSISHTEFTRPASRYSYYDRRSPTRFYTNEARGYPYYPNRSIYVPLNATCPPQSQQQQQYQQQQQQQSVPSLNMSRRVLSSNNNNNNSSYVSPRSQLLIRPSASISASTSFGSPNRTDRHPRY